MAINFPGPYQLRIFYSCEPGLLPQFTHVMQLNVDCDPEPSPGDPFTDFSFIRRVGAPVQADTMVDGFVIAFKAILSLADQEILYCELWKFDEGTFDSQYISTYAINVAGTNGGDSTAAKLDIWTFRTTEGGILKVYTQEGPDTGPLVESYNDLDPSEAAFTEQFTDDSASFFLGRDTSYPQCTIYMSLEFEAPSIRDILLPIVEIRDCLIHLIAQERGLPHAMVKVKLLAIHEMLTAARKLEK